LTKRSLEVFAVDPGGTTGWAWCSLPVAPFLELRHDLIAELEFDCGQVDGLENAQTSQLMQIMYDLRFDGGPLIIEDFVLRKFTKDADLLAPVRITARLEYAVEVGCWMVDGIPTRAGTFRQFKIRKQQPSLAMSTVTDDRLREWGLWEVGQPHARDALRHAVTFLRRAKQDAALRRWAWGLAA
jgi:hypothetical protein